MASKERKPTAAEVEALRDAANKIAEGLGGLVKALTDAGLLPSPNGPKVIVAPPGSVPRIARSIPREVEAIFRAEPRHLFVDEIWDRLRARGYTVKRASIPRTLSRDDQFARYRDGWGLRVLPGDYGEHMVGTTTNPNHDPLSRPWGLDPSFRLPDVDGHTGQVVPESAREDDER
jgi:hypothetical protein